MNGAVPDGSERNGTTAQQSHKSYRVWRNAHTRKRLREYVYDAGGSNLFQGSVTEREKKDVRKQGQKNKREKNNELTK